LAKRFGWLLLVAALIALPAAALGQDATGDWLGTLQTGPLVSLRLAVHIKADGHGGFQGTLDSLDQNTFGLPLVGLTATPEVLSFKVPTVGGAYSAKWDANAHAWVGEWRQGAAPLPLTLARPAAHPVAWAIPSDAEIGRLLDARIAGRPGEGIVVGIVTPAGRRIVARGPKGAKPFNGRTLFEIGSVTKVFTGLLLADMARRGEVRLDDLADKYLPAGFALPSRNGRRITLLDLATHRSGLPRMPDNFAPANPANPYADYSQRDLLAYLKSFRPTRDSGSQYEYSNLGVGLLGQLLARRAGTNYATLVRRRITGPLGMADTMIRLSPAQRARLAQPHDEYMRPVPAWDLNALAGAGGLRSDADDLLTFLSAAMKLVPSPLAADLADMQVRRAGGATPNMGTGIIWVLLKTSAGEIVFHNGATGGSKAFIGFDPARKRGIVVLVNGAPEPATDDLGLHLLTGSPLIPVRPLQPAPREWKIVTLSPAQLDRLTGIYRFGPQATLTVRREGGQLTAQLSGQSPLPIFPSSETEFFLKAVDAQVSFALDASGRASKVVLHQGGHDTPVEREP
jgi:D-alanyl-D-alanine-carboxypeptidase/D-alanyl-D-alanine-endopeptidase